MINDKLKVYKKDIFKFYKIQNITKKEIHSSFFDYIFITNEISKHINTLLKYQNSTKNFFIEKPISSNLSKISKVKKLKNKGINIYVGYQLRFHPGIKTIKKYIEKRKLGNLISGSFNFGEYLPMMHKYEDYSKTHMSIKKLGGGAVSCLSHEIDLILHLIGKPKKIKSVASKSSKLKINVEDNLRAILLYPENINISLNLDFLTYPPQHFIILNFEKGTLNWNYFNKKLIIYNNYSKKNILIILGILREI